MTSTRFFLNVTLFGLWLSFFAILAPSPLNACDTLTTVILNGSLNAPDHFLYLSPASSAVPSGWQLLGFDDSTWPQSVPWTINAPTEGFGNRWSARDLSGTSNGDDSLLLRQSFNMISASAGTILGGTLELCIDDRSVTWLNGVAVQTDAPGYISDNKPRTFTLNSLTPGANVLAIQVFSPVPPSMGANFRLTLRYRLACVDPAPQPAPPADSYSYPVPATGDQMRVAFDMPCDGTARLRAYALSGRLLSETNSFARTGQTSLGLDLKNFAQGTYAYVLTLEACGVTKTLPMKIFMVQRP